jgi:GTP cyclohydrolase I
MTRDDALAGLHDVLAYLGPKEPTEHTIDTPERMLRGLEQLLIPNPEDISKFTVFPNDNRIDEMVTIKDIQFQTLCAHHVLPFFGVCHVAYIPYKRLCGLSKIPRAVRFHSRGLNVQENLTHNIATFLEDQLVPKGVAVIMEAEHMCMTIRGVQAQGTTTQTSAMRGVFLEPSKGARAEFLQLIHRSS